MAIWQFDLYIIPSSCEAPVMLDSGWELPHWHAGATLEAQQYMVDAFKSPWLMMEDWLVFGGENDTRVDLLFFDADELEIRCRLTASASDVQFLAISAFAAEINALFFNPATGETFTPDPNKLAAAFANSRAACFSNNPRAFISNLAAN